MAFVALRNWLLRRHRDLPGGDVPGRGTAGLGTAGLGTAGLGDAAAAAVEPAPIAYAPSSTPARRWGDTRLAIAEDLWGSGFLTAGGGAELLRLAAPIGLSAASTLLLLGVGAGGPPQTLATDLGVWVTGYEADPELAGIASRRIQRAGDALAKRASVALWDPDAPHFPARLAHHALALDAIRHATATPVLAAIAAALRPHGHIVLVETVAPVPLDLDDPVIAAWFRLEGRRSAVPEPDAITGGLSRLGFDVRVVEDISARHMGQALLGWRHLVRLMARERPTPERAAAVVAEAELWTRRIRLMHGGQIRLMRWHAIAGSGPAGGPGG